MVWAPPSLRCSLRASRHARPLEAGRPFLPMFLGRQRRGDRKARPAPSTFRPTRPLEAGRPFVPMFLGRQLLRDCRSAQRAEGGDDPRPEGHPGGTRRERLNKRVSGGRFLGQCMTA